MKDPTERCLIIDLFRRCKTVCKEMWGTESLGVREPREMIENEEVIVDVVVIIAGWWVKE